METKGTKGDDIMKKGTRTILMSSALAACVLAVVTGCGQVRPEEKQSESTTVQTEPAQVVTEAPIVIQTEAPQTEPQTQAPETQAPETQAPETKAPETQAPETSAEAPAEDGGNNTGLIIGIAAAVIVIGAIAGVVIAKKKK